MDLVIQAYKKLKQLSYYDTVNIYLRHRIAEFESSEDFIDRIKTVSSVAEKLEKSNSTNINLLNSWIKEICFHCLPKKVNGVQSKKDDGSCHITNVRTSKKYEILSVNYFIDAPVELHILDVLWSMTAGAKLDRKLDNYCLGNRIDQPPEGQEAYETEKLFKIFHRQYAKWRDTAIEKAQKALENGTNILLIGMDIKECYYHISPDYDKIEKYLEDNNISIGLFRAIRKIQETYNKILKEHIIITHSTVKPNDGIPIGLSSSHIIANWTMGKFDQQVNSTLRPLYYGRYVDDILIVLQSPPESASIDSSSAVNQLFIKNGLLVETEDSNYLIKCLPTLRIQTEKLIFQYFDAQHSHAGLKEFSREIAEKASEFRFLPVGDSLKGIDECAYDLIFQGSVNKLRSVVRLEENSTELSKYLSRRIIQYHLSRDGLTKKNTEQLFRFYKGRNIFDFCRLWEKVFTLLLTNQKEYECAKFYNQCIDVIHKMEYTDSIVDKLKKDTELYLDLSISMPLGLMPLNFHETCKSKTLKKLILKEISNNNLNSIAKVFRNSNMIRHHFVSFPLLNFTSYEGNLVSPIADKIPTISDWDIVNRAKYSPRHIHYDEIQLFSIFYCLFHGDTGIGNHIDKYKSICSKINKRYDIISSKKINKNVQRIKFPNANNNETERSVIVGIANMKASEEDIERAFNPTKKQNLSYERQSNLYSILNVAIENRKCDIVVFPELSIPFAWVPTMVSFARKHQIGIVFGTEHVVVDKKANNIVFSVLPYRNKHKHKGCYISARLKNFYAPAEENALRLYGLEAMSPNPPYYELFSWDGYSFSVFNCFELTNIAHRGFMQSELDFLVTVAWNKDIGYYDHILTSTSRDLHCYIVHSNTSQYGDSRVIAPKKQEDMDYVRIKGGINPVLIKAEIDLNELRDFQIKEYDPNDKRFKPTPAGFDRSKVRGRLQP